MCVPTPSSGSDCRPRTESRHDEHTNQGVHGLSRNKTLKLVFDMREKVSSAASCLQWWLIFTVVSDFKRLYVCGETVKPLLPTESLLHQHWSQMLLLQTEKRIMAWQGRVLIGYMIYTIQIYWSNEEHACLALPSSASAKASASSGASKSKRTQVATPSVLFATHRPENWICDWCWFHLLWLQIASKSLSLLEKRVCPLE